MASRRLLRRPRGGSTQPASRRPSTGAILGIRQSATPSGRFPTLVYSAHYRYRGLPNRTRPAPTLRPLYRTFTLHRSLSTIAFVPRFLSSSSSSPGVVSSSGTHTALVKWFIHSPGRAHVRPRPRSQRNCRRARPRHKGRARHTPTRGAPCPARCRHSPLGRPVPQGQLRPEVLSKSSPLPMKGRAPMY